MQGCFILGLIKFFSLQNTKFKKLLVIKSGKSVEKAEKGIRTSKNNHYLFIGFLNVDVKNIGAHFMVSKFLKIS